SEMMTPRSQIVLFTGPAAAGKSTVAEAWATSRSAPTALRDPKKMATLTACDLRSATRNKRSNWMQHQPPRLRPIYLLLCLLFLLAGCSSGPVSQDGGPGLSATAIAPTSAPAAA